MQRAVGKLALRVASDGRYGARLADLREQGSFRSIFPRPSGNSLDAVLLNTAGGVTGGDQFSIHADVEAGASLSLTTQAAERIYAAIGEEAGLVRNRATVAPEACLHWLPQETILFEGCNLDRRLDVDLAEGAGALILEPLVFGRGASGESIRNGALRDRVQITRVGSPIYLDGIQMSGDLTEQLDRSVIGGGARAMASLIYVGTDAEARLDPLRGLLPDTGGASMTRSDVLVMRLLAIDSYALRQTLLPILKLLTDDSIPKNWRL
ncbi:urease accessory protein UreD [Alphaproteobacteria bacterium KMM 3653]|uniref:Urease accessory protein UreD n=2 Tax=Harenicola maris TaxID=2841044 RepID=A0AAP2CT87_9RHOB|nr:urease accessory protein UreD [Harenicola maris]